MGDNGIRWEQRFSNDQKALHQLKEAVDLIEHIGRVGKTIFSR